MTLGRMARLIHERDALFVSQMLESPTRAVEDAFAVRNRILCENPAYHAFVEWANFKLLGRDADFMAADELFGCLSRQLRKLCRD